MSVSAFREIVEKPGCRWFVSIVMLGFAFGMMGITRGCGNQNPDQAQKDQGPSIAKIGDFRVLEQPIREKAQQQTDPLTSTPAMAARNYGQALDGEITQGLLLMLAKQYNVGMDDKSILQAASSQLDDSVMQQKMILGLQKKIPQNATDQQFDDYLKKTTGHTLAEQKKQIMDGLQAQLNDPSQKSQVLGEMANALVEKGIEGSINPSDQELQHSQDDYNTKRIYFDSVKHPKEDVQKLAQSVLDQVKSGKLTFEQAMDKYTDDPAGKGRAAHENTNTVPKQTIDSDPSFAPLGPLKVGQMTDVIPVPPSGYAIYRLDSIKPNVPPDFAKNKENLRKTYVQLLSASKLQAGLKQLRAQNVIKWNAPGWDVLYNWYQATIADNSFGTKPTTEQHKIYSDFLQQGMSSSTTPGMLAAAGAIDPLWSSASAAEKKDLTPKYIAILSAVTQDVGSYPGCILLAQLAADQKDSKTLGTALLQAAQLNMPGVSQPAGATNFEDLQGYVEKYQASGLLKPDQVKNIQDALNQFRNERASYEEDMRKQRQQEAADRAKADADAKKAAEEAKKAAAKQKTAKPAAPGAPGPVSTGTTGALLNLPPKPTGATPVMPGATPPPPAAPKPAATTGK